MKNNKGQFVKGSTPHNKGKKQVEYISPDKIENIKATQFKVDGLLAENHPSWKGGIQQPKGDCNYIYKDKNTRLRKPRVIYEENFGPIPKGYVVWHKDGNKKNDHPDNLEAISRAEMMRRNGPTKNK